MTEEVEKGLESFIQSINTLPSKYFIVDMRLYKNKENMMNFLSVAGSILVIWSPLLKP